MDPQLRAQFNDGFTPEKYAGLVRCVNETEKWPADFRISETPIFLTRDFTDEVTSAANAIVALTRTPESKTRHISICCDAQLTPIRLQKISSYLRSSRKSKKHGSISLLRKPFSVSARFA